MTDAGPYESMSFRVKWDGRYIVGLSKASGLRWSSEVVLHRDGGDTRVERKLPGRTKYEALALERGLTADTAFYDWAQEMVGGEAVPTGGFLKDISLELYDAEAQLVLSYLVYGCWPSGYEALSSLDADGNSVAVERMILEYDTWARDTSVVPPQEA